jgi:hypothetical protein
MRAKNNIEPRDEAGTPHGRWEVYWNDGSLYYSGHYIDGEFWCKGHYYWGGEAEIINISLYDNAGLRIEVVRVGQPVTLRIEVNTRQQIENLILGFGIKDRIGQLIYGSIYKIII